MEMTRRQFISGAGMLAAGGFLGSGWWPRPWLQRALAATIGERYFVVVFLDGGNDGLNTVVPLEDGDFGSLRTAYEAARHGGPGGLRLTTAELSSTAIGTDPLSRTPLALHPGLSGLAALCRLGHVAILQGCGYPQYDLSHEVSRSAWQTANPLGLVDFREGWMGRYLKANYALPEIPAVCVRNDVAPEFAQTVAGVLAIPQLRDFSFPYDAAYAADELARRDAFAAIHAEASASTQSLLRYLGDSGGATLRASERYPPLSSLYASERPDFYLSYDTFGTNFSIHLREVASIIYGVERGSAGIDARFFQLAIDGYDLHADQGSTGPNAAHHQRHLELGGGLETFAYDCMDMGVWDKVCILVVSEFGRRIIQNANGTDHGSQAPVFVIGGAVRGGIYGHHPNINAGALDDYGNTVYSQAADDPCRSIDLRDVYATVLQRWLGMPDPLRILPVDGGDPNRYWTAPDSNLGFLT
jgi:uncharacterized protein (DUF1501 family)